MKHSKIKQMVRLHKDGVSTEVVLEIIITLESNKQRLVKAIMTFFELLKGVENGSRNVEETTRGDQEAD